MLMIPYNQVVNGVTKYIDSEILPKVDGWSKIAVGIVLAGAVKKGDAVVEQIKTIPIVKMIGIVDEEDRVDVETIYEEMKKHISREPLRVELPMIGALTFNTDDVEKLYAHIMGGAA